LAKLVGFPTPTWPRCFLTRNRDT